MLGLYLHIPFCSALCNYCNFTRGLLDDALKTRYVTALVAEIERAAEAETAADTLYFGGGTPSLLSVEDVSALIEACRRSFALTADAEVTLEANPESVSSRSLAGYRSAGVNRLSFGVQSFRNDELKRLGRLHSAETARRVVPLARAAGFDNVSLDLMMWLPEQPVDQWLESVDALIGCEPDHASLYLLELYPNAPLRDDMARAGWSQAPDEDAAGMYLAALDRLAAAGYEQYEISNVARPGRRARHNVKYWQDGAWCGFGAGAHSTRHGQRWRNASGTMDYIRRVDQTGSGVAERQVLDPQTRLEDTLFTGLRLTEGLDLGLLASRYGVDVWDRYGAELARFVDVGLLIHRPSERLALTRPGMLLANEIMAVFIGPPVR
ncbi:MAG: radical SAM family heme chaperone HemW [Acidobacteriota bacterium]